jgi:hypothetical protein
VDTRLSFDLLLTLSIVSFVDRDMVMRFFGDGIGHLKNAPPQQVPLASSEEVEEDSDNNPCNSTNGTIVQQSSRDVVMNSTELEVSEGGGDEDEDEDEDNDDDDDDDDGNNNNDSDDGNEGGDQTDEDEDEDEDEDDYGYASP